MVQVLHCLEEISPQSWIGAIDVEVQCAHVVQFPNLDTVRAQPFRARLGGGNGRLDPGAIRVVQGFRREKDEVKRFGGAARRDVRSGLKASRFEAKLKWSAELAVSLITALIVLLAAQRIMGGSMSVGDLVVFVSYLRLFALGLASASLAAAFNDMASDVRQALPGIGMLFALLILLLGHALNFLLSVASGFIHGLRLNVIEFFKWGVQEEGNPYRPFARKESS